MEKTAQPKSQTVTRRTFDEVMVQTYAPSTFVPVRGSGMYMWDQEGRQYLDLTGGIAVTALGHTPPVLVEVLKKQAETLWHACNYYTNEPVLRLASAMTAATFADRAFFCNSGGEANEAALKLARRWAHDRHGPQKSRIVSFLNSFHGRTLFTVSVGGQPKYSEGFGPLPGMIDHIPYNDIEAAKKAIGDDVCAVIVEPVQGEGGVLPASPAFLKTLRELCDRHKALLIFDEIQSGMGRTGKLFAYMDYGVCPDILTSAKALANGFPIGAMLTTEDIASVFTVGVHGTTFGGNPLAAAVACKVMETINTPVFLSRVESAGASLKKMLEGLAASYPQAFGGVRGKGLMLGLVMAESCRGRAKEVTAIAEKEGLLLLLAGPDVIRIVPPLIIEETHIREAEALLRQSIEKWLGNA